jgi:hypothetical protein
VSLDSALLRSLLLRPECRRAMLRGRPGLAAYDARCLAETYVRERGGDPDEVTDELQDWARLEGGDFEWLHEPPSARLRPLARPPSPLTLTLWLPHDMLSGG